MTPPFTRSGANRAVRQVGYFLSGQYVSTGLRTTLAILLPALLGAQAGQLPTGMQLSLGALSVSVTDAPGPLQHRRNGMTATLILSTLVALATGFSRMNPYALGVEIVVFGFFFSLFAVWGSRATSVGNAALLVMILTLDRPLDAAGVLRESALIGAGGLWYAIISLLASRLQPYRAARQALGQCIHEIAKLLTLKADFYTITTRLDDDYRHLLTQQVAVSEQQDAVRELLFKSRQFGTESTPTGRQLVLTFVDVVDLYEQIVALYYDYATLRERFGATGLLDAIAGLIRQLADELDYLGLAIQSPVPLRGLPDLSPALSQLNERIDALGDSEGSTRVLKKILVNLRIIAQRLNTLHKAVYQSTDPSVRDQSKPDNDLELGRFVSHQAVDLKSLRNNLTLDSLVFRHSARVSLAMGLGYVLTQVLPYGHHSYWVLLTISVILKPAFSLTKQRNTQRILGTLAGGLLGVAILRVVPDKTARFVLMVAFMLGTYSTQRVYYVAMVVCVTPFILILFSFLGVGYVGAAGERFFDTLLGGLLALGAGYGLFPRWESEQLTEPMRAVLTANIRYVRLLLDTLSGRPIPVTEYKLVRKDVYVSSANLAAAFERMLSEPKHKQRNEQSLYEFVLLNHVLSANVATLVSARLTGAPGAYPEPVLRPVRRALYGLIESLNQFGETPESIPPETIFADAGKPAVPPDDPMLTEQVRFILQVSTNIRRTVEQISPAT